MHGMYGMSFFSWLDGQDNCMILYYLSISTLFYIFMDFWSICSTYLDPVKRHKLGLGECERC
jgi:hypothetical protein